MQNFQALYVISYMDNFGILSFLSLGNFFLSRERLVSCNKSRDNYAAFPTS